MEEKKVKKSKSELDEKWEKAIPVYYVRFHQAVPPSLNKEPVQEFKLKSDQVKYKVDGLKWLWGDGLLFKAYGEIDFVPAANVQYVRFTL